MYMSDVQEIRKPIYLHIPIYDYVDISIRCEILSHVILHPIEIPPLLLFFFPPHFLISPHSSFPLFFLFLPFLSPPFLPSSLSVCLSVRSPSHRIASYRIEHSIKNPHHAAIRRFNFNLISFKESKWLLSTRNDVAFARDGWMDGLFVCLFRFMFINYILFMWSHVFFIHSFIPRSTLSQNEKYIHP